MKAPTCGITITTHNRLADLQRTCAVIAGLSPPPDEVLISADGCTDGTVEFLQSLPKSYRTFIYETSRSSVINRDAMMRAAASDVLLSLDDDSHPIDSDVIARLGNLFAQNPRLAAASFPQRSDEEPASLQQTDFGQPRFVGSFSNAAAAYRRSAFIELGGYAKNFQHAYEEPDFTLRCVAAGWQVKFEPAIIIRHHYTQVQRNEMRTHHLHARNELASVVMRCPLPQLLGVAAFRAARQFGYARKRGWKWMIAEPKWWMQLLRELPYCWEHRTPIPWPSYRAWMELVRAPIYSEQEWKARFAPRD